MKPFRFQQFSIEQSKKVFAIGTDGVLLGALCHCSTSTKILEVGTGTGLISLMIAQRNPTAHITAIDISPEAVELANHNFIESPFHERLNAQREDFTAFTSAEKYDFIISNPPYFAPNSSQKHISARQQITLSYENLIKKSSKLLDSHGRFSVIIPYDDVEYFVSKSEEYGLFLVRKINIIGIEGGKVVRAIIELGFDEKPLDEEFFTIEKSPRKYSEQYLLATEDFHVFNP